MGKLGKMHQSVERNIQYEILTDSKKARAFVQLQKSIQNFVIVMGDIDIHLVIKPWKDGEE